MQIIKTLKEEDSFIYSENLKNLSNYQYWLLEHQITAFWHGFGISNGIYIKEGDYSINKGGCFIKPIAMQCILKEYIKWLNNYKFNWCSKEDHPLKHIGFNDFIESEKIHNSREDILKMICLLQD